MNDDGARNLAQAIVKAAVEDYCKCARDHVMHLIRKGETDADLIASDVTPTMRAMHRVFRSEWFYALGGLDGDAVLRGINARIRSYTIKKLSQRG